MSSLKQLENFNSPDDLLRFQRRSVEQEALNKASERKGGSDWSKEHRLQLLMPLASKEVLEVCRQRAVQRPNHSSEDLNVEKQEVLDLEPLFKSWRTACSSWSFDDTQHQQKFIFDITLPERSSEEMKIAWGHSRMNGFHFLVVEEHVSRFVQGLATVMSIRSRDKAVFEVSGVEQYRRVSTSPRSEGYFKGLQVVLEELSAKVET